MTAVVSVKCLSVNGYSFINIKLWYYGLSLFNMLMTAAYMLSLDWYTDEDPLVREYYWIRWHLVTIWFNMLLLFYIPLCMYCDWREKNGQESPQMAQLRKLRDVVMAGILFPVTLYCDVMFWILFTSFPWIIGPARMLEIVPLWVQNTFHTMTLVFVMVDLLLTPRHRPRSNKTNLTVLYGFSLIYTLDMFANYMLGGYVVYGFLRTASKTVCLLTVVGSFLAVTASYHVQWYIVDYVWGRQTLMSQTESKLE